MTVDIVAIVVICILASLAYWVNERLNTVPLLKTIVGCIIVVLAVLLILQSAGFISNGHIAVR